ncbi:MAG TPA: O-antigen ligase family protein [Pyrinomonadaceae bacterium]|jgi:O-antigen ligase|nr:O-antigen ligase family protein [Pyrinomonadaceae bacterium]
MARSASFEVGIVAAADRPAVSVRVARILGTTIYVVLLCQIVLTAIPYGTSQPWWIAAFVAIVFALAILWLVEGTISQSWFADSWPLILPAAALALFSFLQTVPFGNRNDTPAGISYPPWNAISSDPYQTRFFALLLLALTLSGIMLARYAASEKRLRIVIDVVIGVAVASALFGILRQTTQTGHEGFGLPLLFPWTGYGQFINRNHFPYLMEMSLGLILGLILGHGVKRDRGLLYFAALLPIWTGLVLSGSRGGLIAMLVQLVAAAFLFSFVRRRDVPDGPPARIVQLTRSLPIRVALVLTLIGGIVLGTLWLGGDQLATRIEQSRNELAADTTGLRWGVSRNDIWKATWQMFKTHPVLGVGMGGYWAAIPAFHDASGTMTPQEAHNDYLELLASGGVVGFALALWFAAVVFKRTRENLSAPNRFRRAACFGAAIGIAGVAVHSLVDFGLHTIVNALVFTTLIVIATSKPHWGNEPAKQYD